MKFKIIILALNFIIFVIAFETPGLQRNLLKFGYDINYEYEGQLFF